MRSIADAIAAVRRWLALTPEMAIYGAERQRMLALAHLLEHVQADPTEAHIQAARQAVRATVRFARTCEQRRAASMPPERYRRLDVH